MGEKILLDPHPQASQGASILLEQMASCVSFNTISSNAGLIKTDFRHWLTCNLGLGGLYGSSFSTTQPAESKRTYQ